ncbi:MAG TPA: GTP 3',8-cyclase MoaA [Dissulfurispiraceae bacterium]|nr:GTP 3',8-cyclase MoaA [Dissulfurispiraceae bacterium]
MDAIRDTFDRVIDYLRISITDRCNLRCVYCMPSGGVNLLRHEDILRYEELTRIVRVAASLGVRKVRITGGEPLARRNVAYLIRSIRAINGIEDISLTTNGLLLAKLVPELAAAGLSRVNVSIDSLQHDRYAEITRGGSLELVLQGIQLAADYGLRPVKINVVPIRGINDDEIEAFARLTLETPYHVRFIEFMPAGTNDLWSADRVVTTQEIISRVEKIATLTPVKVRRDGPARYFSFADAPGVLGFISPVSHHFCSSCNRLRLTADGKLRPCLFSETEIDIRAALRNGAPDEELERLLRIAVEVKPRERSFDKRPEMIRRRPMSAIGG